MKRCPQCLFIFPESDTSCDFDGTPLVVVDEAELESATSPAPAPAKKKPAAGAKKRAASSGKSVAESKSGAGSKSAAESKSAVGSKKNAAGSKRRLRKNGTAVAAVVGLVFGLAVFFVYSRVNSIADEVAEIPPVATMSMSPVAAPLAVSTPVAIAIETASPTPVASAATPATAASERTSHSRTTVAPVSTSGPGMGKKLGGKPAILLTTGARIDADEVWRTRDGVWYRRAGIVTLLKHNRVKAIVNQ